MRNELFESQQSEEYDYELDQSNYFEQKQGAFHDTKEDNAQDAQISSSL